MHDVPGQTHWHEPAGGKRAGFGKFGRPKTPYDLFMESEGIPVFRDIGVSKVQNLPLAPWKRLGGRGTYIQLYGTEGKWGCYVVEVPGAGALNRRKASLRGNLSTWSKAAARPKCGSTAIRKRHVFEWQQGSLFSIPVNACHRIVNASSAPALLLAGTTAPNLMNLINNVGAIFDCPYQFRDRFSGADDFYKYKDDIEPDPVRGLAMRRTNFVPDIVNCDLPLDNRRSPGYRRVEPFMTGNTFYLWIAQHENGRYSKAHAHTSAAVLICLKGKGYTYTWPEQAGVTPWQDGKERPDQAGRLRAGRHGVGGARRRALVPPALRRVEGGAAAHRLVRPAIRRGASPARPARRTPTTPRWISPKAAPRSRTGWRIRAWPRNSCACSNKTARRTGCARSSMSRITPANCRRNEFAPPLRRHGRACPAHPAYHRAVPSSSRWPGQGTPRACARGPRQDQP